MITHTSYTIQLKEEYTPVITSMKLHNISYINDYTYLYYRSP